MHHVPPIATGRGRLVVRWSVQLVLAAVIAAPLALLAVKNESATPASRLQARQRMLEKLKQKQLKPFDQPYEAMEFYWAKRSPTGEPLSIAGLEEAESVIEAQEAKTASPSRDTVSLAAAASAVKSSSGGNSGGKLGRDQAVGLWQARGPGNIGGRSRVLIIDRKRPRLMWTAGVAGGIWRSTDGGVTWEPKGDLLLNIAVNSMVQDPEDNHLLFAGTGEGYFNGDAVRGQGIFRSVDFGETWKQIKSTDTPDFYYVQKIALSSHKKGQHVYAATRTGLWRSSDRGDTWTRVIDAAAVRGCMDVVVQPGSRSNPGYVFVSCGTFAQATVYRARDVEDGQTWEPVLSELDMGRTSLALAPSNPAVIYAMASFYHLPAAHPQDDGLLAIYRSTENGAAGTWETRVHYTDANKLNTVQLTNPVYAFLADCGFGSSNQFFKQGWYDNQIAVDPQDENIVWSAGIDTMRSNDGGRTWGLASYWWFDAGDPNYAHADNHAITFHPLYNGTSNRQVFLASDGGIHRSMDARAAVGTTLAAVCGDPVANQIQWGSLNNGYQVTQFYHGAVYPDGTTFFGGTQDNGTVRGTIANGESWLDIRGGDGGYVAVDRTDTNVIYGEYTGKSLQRSTNGGATWVDIHTGVGEAGGNFQFIHPFAMDLTNPLRLFYGGAFAWRTVDRGATWTRFSNSFGLRIASWGLSATNPDKVYVGMQHSTAAAAAAFTGRIYTTAAATTLPTPPTGPGPGPGWTFAQPRQGYVSSIGVDPNNPNIAYATYSTYNFGTNLGHVFKTTDGGVTWTRIDLTLPDMPVHSVVVHPTRPDTLFIGTDLGVFASLNGGASWFRENAGFANVATEHLEINNGKLHAFTHGRSLFAAPIAP